MSRASIQAKADKKRGYRKDYAASAAKIEKRGGPKSPYSSSSSAPTTKTSVGQETADQTVARAKAMLGSAYNPSTPAPSRARMDEIANQSFITPENKAAYSASRPGGALPAQNTALQTAYEGTGNAPAPSWATTPQSSGQGTDQGGGQFSPSTANSNTSGAYQSLLKALQTTSAETDVQNQQTQADQELRNLNRGQEQTNKNLADQPIAKPFITGQQAAVAQQFGIDRGGVQDRMQTLQAKLANLQSQRQSSIDVAKTGLDYGKYQDNQVQQSFQNQQSLAQQQQQQQQYANQQTQQQYENTTNQSRYTDSQTQQSLDNAYRQSQANKPSTASLTTEEKTQQKNIDAMTTEAGNLRAKLSTNAISWKDAFNSMKAKYSWISNEKLDEELNKGQFYEVQGNAGSGLDFSSL